MIEERLVGTNPLIETRRESHESVNKQKRYMQIQNILSDYPNGLTAKEISVEMKKEVMQLLMKEILVLLVLMKCLKME